MWIWYRKHNSKQKWNNDKCQCEFIEHTKHSICEGDYTWNLSMCTWESGKDYDIGKHLKDCTCMESLDELVVTCDEIVNMSEIT